MKEYDLVIVGGGQLGFDTARRAAAFHGRVALVTQGIGLDPRPWQRAAWLNAWRTGDGAEIPGSAAALMAQQQALYYNADSLAQLGIEVIEGLGRFGRKPHLTLDLESGRKLRSRRYLLALPPQRAVVDPLMWQWDQPLPERLVVLGDWEMAMALGRLGRFSSRRQSRTLVFVAEGWAGLDPSVAQWVQVQLEALGVEVWRDRSSLGDRGPEALDCYLQVDGSGPPDYSDLNLPAQWHPLAGLRRDRLGKTTHRRIYGIEHQGEIPTLLHNTMLVAHRPLPLWRQTQHNEVAQWGCASTDLPRGAYLLREELSTLAIAQLQNRPEGFCQLIVQANGKVIGAQMTGDRAGELLAIVMANPTIAHLEQCSEGWARILGVLAEEFWRLRSSKGWRRDLLESFFAWTRPWR
jgi:hypothetical protein